MFTRRYERNFEEKSTLLEKAAFLFFVMFSTIFAALLDAVNAD